MSKTVILIREDGSELGSSPQTSVIEVYQLDEETYNSLPDQVFNYEDAEKVASIITEKGKLIQTIKPDYTLNLLLD